MAELVAQTPLDHMRPVQIGSCILTEPRIGKVQAILPYPGELAAASRQLAAHTGLAFPEPGCAESTGDLRLLWSGREQAFAVGDLPEGLLSALLPNAAMVDLSDAWSVLRLSGAATRDVLARLTPLDLRPSEFPVGRTARTELKHMSVMLVSLPSAVEIWGFRSMAETLRHDLAEAMTMVAARASHGL